MVLRVVTFVYACLHVYSCSSVSPLCIYSTGLLPCINLSIQESPKAADTADKLAAMGLTSSLDYDTDDCEGVCVCVCACVHATVPVGNGTLSYHTCHLNQIYC